ncbi:MAG: hypothetical protein P4L87_26435, partial [Formivibrio sp.]|nr:hypothetical protein [Formivibrio sp.]
MRCCLLLLLTTIVSVCVPSPQFTLQRQSSPDFGLREDILLPWYHAFADQYVRKPWGGWQGNATLLPLYESMAWKNGEDRFGRFPTSRGRDPVTGL